MKDTHETKKEGLTIVRTFDAPQHVVFDAFSTAEALGDWWGPAGSSISVKDFSFIKGGTFHYKLESDHGVMWGLFKFGAIERPNLLEFVSSFSDDAGNVCKAPFDLDFPLEIFNRITFTEADHKTTITLKGHPINATEAQEATYYAITENMQQGFKGTFDQLDAYLAKQAKK